MGKNNKKSCFVEVVPRFLRSVNLHNDWQNTGSSSGYIVTPNVIQSLDQLIEGLITKKGQRAFALTGPYGTGKSAFSVFLCQLLSHETQKVKQAISIIPPKYARINPKLRQIRQSPGGREGFLLIPVTARRRPIAQLLLEGFLEALKDLKPSEAVRILSPQIEEALRLKSWRDTAVVLEFLAKIQKEAQKQRYTGVLLLVDEAGKTLEYALQDRVGGDVYIFQELAEYASRQSKIPLLFLITLHQMFDDYVELSNRTLRNEWNKVQERFQPIQFNESAGSTIKLIASAIHQTGDLPKHIGDELDSALLDIKKGSISLPFGLEFAEFETMARNAWPLHPSLLLAMPYLFRRLAQNERSIFSYLTSGESFALQYYLDRPVNEGDSFVRFHHLYAYLLSNFEAGLARLPHAKRLLEANDIIKSRHNLTRSQLEIVQTVALLNVLSEICPIRATAQTIRCAVSTSASVEEDLELLRQQSVVTYRRLDNSYRVWEGSDVDIEARMNEGRRKLQMESVSPLDALRRHLPTGALIARRHSLKTGMSRYFNLLYADNLGRSIRKEAEQFDEAAGTILVLLPQANPDRLKAEAFEITKENKRLIIALPTQVDALRGIAEEVACLRTLSPRQLVSPMLGLV
jgi:RNAse (barnase) inhibitor barstar